MYIFDTFKFARRNDAIVISMLSFFWLTVQRFFFLSLSFFEIVSCICLLSELKSREYSGHRFSLIVNIYICSTYGMINENGIPFCSIQLNIQFKCYTTPFFCSECVEIPSGGNVLGICLLVEMRTIFGSSHLQQKIDEECVCVYAIERENEICFICNVWKFKSKSNNPSFLLAFILTVLSMNQHFIVPLFEHLNTISDTTKTTT